MKTSEMEDLNGIMSYNEKLVQDFFIYLFQLFGIPQHFGLFYAMGFALCMEGFMSGCYHVCPTVSNFQFGEYSYHPLENCTLPFLFKMCFNILQTMGCCCHIYAALKENASLSYIIYTQKTIEGYFGSVPILTFNTIKTKLIMHFIS